MWGRIDDEQAKINLNQQLKTLPDAVLAPGMAIDQALGSVRIGEVSLTRDEIAQQLGLPPIVSWVQVLPGRRPPELLGLHHPGQLLNQSVSPSVVDQATLWGDGRLNFWTADSETVRRYLAGSVKPKTIDALLQLRDRSPQLRLGTLIANAADEDKQDREVLTALLNEESQCYGLWLAIQPSRLDEAPTRWLLMVLESGQGAEVGRIQEYHW